MNTGGNEKKATYVLQVNARFQHIKLQPDATAGTCAIVTGVDAELQTGSCDGVSSAWSEITLLAAAAAAVIACNQGYVSSTRAALADAR